MRGDQQPVHDIREDGTEEDEIPLSPPPLQYESGDLSRSDYSHGDMPTFDAQSSVPGDGLYSYAKPTDALPEMKTDHQPPSDDSPPEQQDADHNVGRCDAPSYSAGEYGESSPGCRQSDGEDQASALGCPETASQHTQDVDQTGEGGEAQATKEPVYNIEEVVEGKEDAVEFSQVEKHNAEGSDEIVAATEGSSGGEAEAEWRDEAAGHESAQARENECGPSSVGGETEEADDSATLNRIKEDKASEKRTREEDDESNHALSPKRQRAEERQEDYGHDA